MSLLGKGVAESSEKLYKLFSDDNFITLMSELRKTDTNNYRKLCWLEDIHKSLYSNIELDGELVEVDNGLVDSIQYLNEMGFKTKYSCDGHFINNAYVLLDGLYEFPDLRNISVEYNVLLGYTILRSNNYIVSRLEAQRILYEFNLELLSLGNAKDYKCNDILDIEPKFKPNALTKIFYYINNLGEKPNLATKDIKLIKFIYKDILDKNKNCDVNKLNELIQPNIGEMSLF